MVEVEYTVAPLILHAPLCAPCPLPHHCLLLVRHYARTGHAQKQNSWSLQNFEEAAAVQNLLICNIGFRFLNSAEVFIRYKALEMQVLGLWLASVWINKGKENNPRPISFLKSNVEHTLFFDI